ncbi:MAG: PilX N-terminal domain-containing pilus assembly protein [Gemmatimonadales bacterium]
MSTHPTPTRHPRGMALVVVMLLTVAIAALAAGAIFLSSSNALIARGQEREEDMRNAADAGIELGRSALNGTPSLFPDTGYTALQVNSPVYDASGNLISGVTRSVYYGPTGSSTGQYGIFGSVVSVITDRTGAVVVRRGELSQESFARFAYYTDSEGSGICFGNGDQIWGPVHTNDDLCIYSSGARFRNFLEVSGTITGLSYGTFDMGYVQHGAVVPLPTMADLAKLNTYATAGGMAFTAVSGGTTTQSTMRIEFWPLDLDGDGRVTGPTEGFFRIYKATAAAGAPYVTATAPSSNPTYSNLNCGDWHTVTGGSPANPGLVFYTTPWHLGLTASPGTWFTSGVTGHTTSNLTTLSNRQTNGTASVQQTTNPSRCWLGGDDHLFVLDSVGGYRPRNTFRPTDAYGGWVKYTTTPDAAIIAALKNPASGAVDTTLAARTLEAQYLWPLSRQYNPNSKGVIYVTGKVVVSGVVNGKVTLAASDNIIIADDIKYAIAPGSTTCLAANMLGLLTPGYIYLSDNELNTPQQWGASSSWRSYASTTDEYIQGVLMTLNSFQVENYDGGPDSQEPCGTTATGRGCLALTGGIIQSTRGAVGTTGGTGYVKRYSYDNCAFQTPPPYFPTTGRFYRNRYYEIDPVGFNVTSFFQSLTPNH